MTNYAPAAEVFARIARQGELMAWPAVSGTSGRVEGPDGAVGAPQAVGRVPGRRVVLRLSDPSPFRQTPGATSNVAPPAGPMKYGERAAVPA